MIRQGYGRLARQSKLSIAGALLALAMMVGMTTQAGAMSVHEMAGFSTDGTLGMNESGLVLAAGDYSASLLNLDVLGGFSDLVFALVDSGNNLVLKLTNSVADSTTHELFSLAGGSYTAVLAGATPGYSFARAQIDAVPLPPAIWLLGAAVAGLVSVGRRARS